MALIDELRYSQAQVQKHLDLPGHRKAVAERIREFYRSRGVEVEDALVEEGVRNFFAARFTYETPQIAPWSRFLARVYINRGKWFKPAAIVLALSLGSVFVGPSVSDFFGDVLLRSAQIQVDKARDLAREQSAQSEQLQRRVSQLEADVAAANLPAAGRMLGNAKGGLEKVRGLTQITLPLNVTAQSRNEDFDLARSSIKSLQKDAIELQRVDTQLSDVSLLLSVDLKLKSLLTADQFPSTSRTYPAVTAAVAKARSVLDQADTQGVPAAQAAVDQVEALIAQTVSINVYLSQLKAAQGDVQRMGLSKTDMDQFQPLFAKVNEAVRQMDAGAAERGLQEIERLRAVAATPLTLEVVSRAGEKSMVERNYDPTGGKTWYLLTEATDASGNVVPVPVTSVETGERRYASVFGVRVSRATYEETKNDKLLDGHVDNRLMGKKAANSLTFTFLKGPVKTKPDYLLEWQ